MRAWKTYGVPAVAVLLVLAWGLLRYAAIDRPFWMDESFSAALAFQSPSKIVDVCQKDVHPPGYYLMLRGWNALMRMILRSPEPEVQWRLIDFRLPAIETMGLFEWEGPNGRGKTPGVFLKEPVYWSEVPLAPIQSLRLMSVILGGLAMLFTALLAQRLFPGSRFIPLLVIAFYALSGFTLTWDTVIRSYSSGAAFTSALALAGVWGLQTGRLKLAALLVAVLMTGAFLTNYPTLVVLPGIALLIWLAGGSSRRSLAFTAAGFALGAMLILLLWGRSFFGQFGKVPSEPVLALPFSQALGDQFQRVILDYWRLLFVEGIWHWMANQPSDYIDTLVNLSPTNPVLYLTAFGLYSAAIVAVFHHLLNRKSPVVLGIVLAALLPGLFIMSGNVVKPGFFRLHARHLYPAAPFFYLMLAYGLSVVFRCGCDPARAAERPASQPVENAS